MKRFFFVWLIALCVLSSVSAEDWSTVPSGKGRVIIFADFVIEPGPTKFQLDKEDEFAFSDLKKNLVLDLAPGRHTFKVFVRSIFGETVYSDTVSLVIADGNLVHLQYTMKGYDTHIFMVTPSKFHSIASTRPALFDPFAGGQE